MPERTESTPITDRKFLTGRMERAGYYGYFVGQNIIYIFVTLFLSVYYTTALGIPPATVGAILLGARIWDAVNDPLLSVLIEKANLRGGKFKPWINSVAILIPLSTVLVFGFTDVLIEASLALRVAYATVTYILWGMVYTISDAPAFALATVMTSELPERNTLISYSKLFGFVGLIGSMIASPLIVERAGDNWLFTAAILSAVAFLFLIMIRGTTERVKNAQQSPALGQILNAVFRNRYLLVFVLVFIISQGFNFGMTIVPFIANDVFRAPGMLSIITVSTLVPSILVVPFLPRLIRRFGKIVLFKAGMIAIVVFSLLTYIVGYDDLPTFLILNSIKAIPTGISLVIPALFFADAIEYVYYKRGERYEAVTFSLQTFSNKAMGAVSGAGGMALLGLFGYVESTAGDVVVQTQRVVDGMWMTFNLGPAIGALIALVVFWFFYDLSESDLEELKQQSSE